MYWVYTCTVKPVNVVTSGNKETQRGLYTIAKIRYGMRKCTLVLISRINIFTKLDQKYKLLDE